jgi:hypothetical protein
MPVGAVDVEPVWANTATTIWFAALVVVLDATAAEVAPKLPTQLSNDPVFEYEVNAMTAAVLALKVTV